MIRRSVLPILVSVGVTLLLLFAGEVAVRLAGIEPMEWPGIEGKLRLGGGVIDPLLGPSLKPGWTGVWPGQFAVAADDRGFRSTGLPRPESPRARVAFMGDSCSFGWGLDTNETFVAELDARQRVDGPPVIDLMNAAYPGNSAVVGEYWLREKILPMHPNMVVLGFSANNAFRLADARDSARYTWFGLRKLLFSSRLWSVAAAWLANKNPPKHNPRTRTVVLSLPMQKLYRIASIDEFENATRAMVADSRAAGAVPVFLVFPRASGVSTQFQNEDAGWQAARLPPPAKDGKVTVAELNLLEASCLDHRKLSDPIATVRAQAPAWRPVYPEDEALRQQLREGARLYQQGAYANAAQRFAEAVRAHPQEPLAQYDLGVAQLRSGADEGLTALATADRLACNVFLQHQIILWRLAQELNVPVVDLMLAFQAHTGEALFLDPAHPNAIGDRLIAEALWPTVQPLTR